MSVVLVAQIMTRCLIIDILEASSWNAYIQLSSDSILQLLFWDKNLQQFNIRSLVTNHSCSRIVYSDASSTGVAEFEVQTINDEVHDSWLPSEAVKSSTWRELCAVYRVLVSLVHVLGNQRVKWFTDNTGVCSIVAKGSMKPELQDLALRIFRFTMLNSIHLEVEWIPREQNERADYLSKIVEVDDWDISRNVLNMVQFKWGKLDTDYFASAHNAKLSRFYLRFWYEGCVGVDAFTYDWGHDFGFYVPPIILVPRVLYKMQSCHASGVLIIPEWKSTTFWPMIWSTEGCFEFFIKDWLYLPTEKSYYTPCKNHSGSFGIEDLKFRMLALLIQF